MIYIIVSIIRIYDGKPHCKQRVYPANTGHSLNSVSMAGQRRRLKQHWVNAPCLLAISQQAQDGSPNVGTMLNQGLKLWANIVPTLGKCFVLGSVLSNNIKGKMRNIKQL